MRILCVLLMLLLHAATARAQTDSEGRENGENGLLRQPQAITTAVALANEPIGGYGHGSKDGFYLELGNMITGSGWISAGPGYRRHFLGGRALVDGSAALSWRAYKIAQARFELHNLANSRLTVGSQLFWQDLTQIDYFGIGAASSQDARSEFRLKDTDMVGYAKVQANRWLALTGTFGRLQRPRLLPPSGPFQRGFGDALLTFASDPGMAAQPHFLHGTVAVVADTRNSPGYTRTGGVFRAAVTADADRDFGRYSFRRYEAEALQYMPVVAAKWTLAFHGWTVASNTSAGNTVPFYMLPALGGNNTLRGYDEYRFHDRHLLLVSAESRWALLRNVDVAAFYDAGNVGAAFGGLNLRKTSWGGGLRLHSSTSTLGRLDIAHSAEGWRLHLRLHDPYRLSRLSRRTADTPFVP